jgi:hypothetical protein
MSPEEKFPYTPQAQLVFLRQASRWKTEPRFLALR